jgi:hypothetical protein
MSNDNPIITWTNILPDVASTLDKTQTWYMLTTLDLGKGALQSSIYMQIL